MHTATTARLVFLLSVLLLLLLEIARAPDVNRVPGISAEELRAESVSAPVDAVGARAAANIAQSNATLARRSEAND